jgi:hypothetical protein
MFGPMKEALRGRRFSSDEVVGKGKSKGKVVILLN